MIPRPTRSTHLQALFPYPSLFRSDRERLAEASADEFLAATDLADVLVADGVPFRESHGIVAGLVRAAMDAGKQLSELEDTEMDGVPESSRERLRDSLRAGGTLEAKVSAGGTSSARLSEQLEAARAALSGIRG
jgi:argininosuccinate lyase